ncbi:MAG: Ig-like domain-containing protein [Ignavibacteria bacterium]|nr:Ig-like domain-containing protein [Ignavibacteria bacterium]
MKNKFICITYFLVLLFVMINSCAVQQPPSGGEDDKIPPEIIKFSPANNTLNFKGRTIEIEFDEYVDRRSFRDALVITPKPKGEVIFGWSGKSVEISIVGGFEPNRTYVITVGKSFKDLRGGNQITEPFSFAFATGSKIDKGKLSGKVFDFNRAGEIENPFRDVVMTAYKVYDEGDVNPETDDPDFILPVNSDGSFEFLSLPEGKYIVFALLDADRNFKYDKTFEFISSFDSIVTIIENEPPAYVQFLMDINPDYITRNIYTVVDTQKVKYRSSNSGFDYLLKKLKTDTVDYLYSSLAENESSVNLNPCIMFYFKNNTVPLFDIVNSISLSLKESREKSYLNFNWYNDSLLGVTVQNFLLPDRSYILTVDVKSQSKDYFKEIEFKTQAERKFGNLKTILTGTEEEKKYIILLINKTDEFAFLKRELINENKCDFLNLSEGDYTLFAFKDADEDGYYDFGAYSPFSPSEKFFFYTDDIKIKGGWTVENFGITF